MVTKTKKPRARKHRDTPEYTTKIEPNYIRSNDPEQEALLAKVQQSMRNAKSRHSVLPTLKVVFEARRLRNLQAELLREIEILEKACRKLETSRVYKSEIKLEGQVDDTTRT